jgi:hypothetical protein
MFKFVSTAVFSTTGFQIGVVTSHQGQVIGRIAFEKIN